LQDDSKIFENVPSNFKMIYIKSKYYRNTLLRLFFEQILLPKYILKYKINVVHSLHYSFPFVTFGAKKIVTVHDMSFYLFPKFHLPIKKIYFKFFISKSTKFADTLVCISKSCLEDLKKYFIIKVSTEIIPHGRDTRFVPIVDFDSIEKVKLQFGLYKYFLFIGTIEPRKNIHNLLKSYKNILAEYPEYKLVIVGKKGWYFDNIFQFISENNLSEKVIFTGYISEYEKLMLINGAKIFIYPSMYEGFGIPVLEAISCGIPTITSNVSSLPEVGGDAVLLIDPCESVQIENAIKKLLKDNVLYELLKKRSIEQSIKFDWIIAAKAYIDLYNKS